MRTPIVTKIRTPIDKQLYGRLLDQTLGYVLAGIQCGSIIQIDAIGLFCRDYILACEPFGIQYAR